MTVLYDWAREEGISLAAIRRLQVRLGTFDPTPAGDGGRSEAAVQAAVRVRASQLGGVFWRNNLGAAYLKDGTFLRYGLANDTPAMNKRVKSSDLIGVRPTLVTAEMVGSTVGIFWAREVKAADWRNSGTDRELAQARFIDIVNGMGGDAAFINDEAKL